MFPDQERLLADITLNRENNWGGIIDLCPGCSRPHTVHPNAKINNVKDYHTDFIDYSLAYQVFILCQKAS